MVTYVVFGILVVIICLLVFFCLTGETDRQTDTKETRASCGSMRELGWFRMCHQQQSIYDFCSFSKPFFYFIQYIYPIWMVYLYMYYLVHIFIQSNQIKGQP